jgi:hypothetical protein
MMTAVLASIRRNYRNPTGEGILANLSPEQVRELQLKWLLECGSDLRARTQAEYLYTAGALAMFGGVCWGIVPLPSDRWIEGIVAAIAIALVARVINKKVVKDHEAYEDIKTHRAKLAEEVDSCSTPVISPTAKETKTGEGFKHSILIVRVAAVVAALLCLVGPIERGVDQMTSRQIAGKISVSEGVTTVDLPTRWMRKSSGQENLSRSLPSPEGSRIDCLLNALHRRVGAVLGLHPYPGRPSAIGAVRSLRHDPFQAKPASGLEYFHALTFKVLDVLAAQKCLQPALTFNEREIAKVGAIKLKNVKRQVDRPIVLQTAVEGLEVTDAVLGQPDDLAIEGDGIDAQLEH